MTKWVRVKITCLIIAWAIKFEGCSGLKSCWGNGAPIASTQQSLKKSFYKWLNRDIYFLERGWIFSLKMKWQQTNKMFTHFIFNTSPRGGGAVLRIRKILASWIWICKNMQIHGAKYQEKLQKKCYSQNQNLNYWKNWAKKVRL